MMRQSAAIRTAPETSLSGVERARSALMDLSRLAQRAALSLPRGIGEAGLLCAESLRFGGTVLACGNGGSAADAQHFVAELVGRMGRERPPLSALTLSVDPSVVTCVANDYGYDEVFARQVRALGQPGDVLLALSTSGRSENVLRALTAAQERDLMTVALVGHGGDPRLEACDVLLEVPSRDTARIQEIHTAALHAICDGIEHRLFG
ncbi:MAG: SIS domain-containing protein [Sandaracinaceae bacterium]